MGYKLEFDENNYKVESITLEGKSVTYRVFSDIVYVKNPVDEIQKMNIFVPELYYHGESMGPYHLHTAPIFMPNTVGGYMPGSADMPGTNIFVGKPNAIFEGLIHGYVVVSPGVRGRVLKNDNGIYIGKAPACIVDLKAAVRYLRYNKEFVPGDTEKIISNGTSAGGALSSLMGATGNSADYENYLEEIGAATSSDAIFASSCYCPIHNLEHADMAYEWMFHGETEYHTMYFEMVDGKPKLTPVNGVMTEEQVALSTKLKKLFPAYLNSLLLVREDGAALNLNENGDGSFKDYVISFLVDSAQSAIKNGTNLSSFSWIKIENAKVLDINYEEYVKFATRMKVSPAFDRCDLMSPENDLFGTSLVNCQHFTEFSKAHSTSNASMAEESIIKLMNPLNYIGNKENVTAKHWRIRHGVVDRDTALAIPIILATTLKNRGYDVDFHLPWGIAHSGDYDLKELFVWIDKICAE